MFREKLKKYVERHPSVEQMEELGDLLEELISVELKENHHEMYLEFMAEFDELVNEITDEDIIFAAENLCRKDGAKGPKWSMEETDKLMHQFNIKEKSHKEIREIEFWFAMNYAFATHASPNKTISVYIDLALDELHDKNVCFKHKIKLLNEKAMKSH